MQIRCPDDAWDSKAPRCDAPLAVPALRPAPPRGRDVGRASSRGNLEPASSAGSALLAMAPALLLVPAALASFVLAFGTGVEFVRFTSLRPLLGGIPESGGPDARHGWLAALQDRSILASLAWDLCLLLLFVVQHSLMATEAVKAWTSRYFGVLQRSLYVACTALALQVRGLAKGDWRDRTCRVQPLHSSWVYSPLYQQRCIYLTFPSTLRESPLQHPYILLLQI